MYLHQEIKNSRMAKKFGEGILDSHIPSLKISTLIEATTPGGSSYRYSTKSNSHRNRPIAGSQFI